MELAPADWEIEVPVELNKDDKEAIARGDAIQQEADLEAYKIRLEAAEAEVADLKQKIADLEGQERKNVTVTPPPIEVKKDEKPAKDEKPKAPKSDSKSKVDSKKGK